MSPTYDPIGQSRYKYCHKSFISTRYLFSHTMLLFPRIHVRRFFFSVNRHGEICSSMDSTAEDTAMYVKRTPKTARDRVPTEKGGFERETFAMTSPDSEIFQNPPSFAKLTAGGGSQGRDSAAEASATLRRQHEPALFYYSVRPCAVPPSRRRRSAFAVIKRLVGSCVLKFSRKLHRPHFSAG